MVFIEASVKSSDVLRIARITSKQLRVTSLVGKRDWFTPSSKFVNRKMGNARDRFGFESSPVQKKKKKKHVLALLASSGAETAKRRKVHLPKKGSTKSAIAETTHAVKTAFCELSRGELSATNPPYAVNRPRTNSAILWV